MTHAVIGAGIGSSGGGGEVAAAVDERPCREGANDAVSAAADGDAEEYKSTPNGSDRVVGDIG